MNPRVTIHGNVLMLQRTSQDQDDLMLWWRQARDTLERILEYHIRYNMEDAVTRATRRKLSTVNAKIAARIPQGRFYPPNPFTIPDPPHAA